VRQCGGVASIIIMPSACLAASITVGITALALFVIDPAYLSISTEG